jgi:hypothetical protein
MIHHSNSIVLFISDDFAAKSFDLLLPLQSTVRRFGTTISRTTMMLLRLRLLRLVPVTTGRTRIHLGLTISSFCFAFHDASNDSKAARQRRERKNGFGVARRGSD